jgi:hypothetical protein
MFVKALKYQHVLGVMFAENLPIASSCFRLEMLLYWMYKQQYLMILSLLFNNAASIKACVSDRMINKCGAVGGMRNGRGNSSTQRKSTPVALCPSQMLCDLNWDQTQAAVVRNI